MTWNKDAIITRRTILKIAGLHLPLLWTGERAFGALAAAGPERIIFWEREKEGGCLAALEPNGARFTTILRDEKEFKLAQRIRLSPDGKLLAYGFLKKDPPYHLALLDHTKPGRGIELGVPGSCWCWSGDGSKLFFDVWTDDAVEHFSIDVKTKEQGVFKLPATHVIEDCSPDSEHFLMSNLFGESEETELHVVRRRDLKVERLSPEKRKATCGRFSPDGKKAAFVVHKLNDDEPRTSHVYVADIGDRKSSQVSPELNGMVTDPCWSPDGKSLAYVWTLGTEPVETYLMVVGLDDKQSRVLFSQKASSWTIFSPDWR